MPQEWKECLGLWKAAFTELPAPETVVGHRSRHAHPLHKFRSVPLLIHLFPPCLPWSVLSLVLAVTMAVSPGTYMFPCAVLGGVKGHQVLGSKTVRCLCGDHAVGLPPG